MPSGAHDNAVAALVAGPRRADDASRDQRRRHVFEAVQDAVQLTGQQPRFELVRPQRFAPWRVGRQRVQWRRLVVVARRRHRVYGCGDRRRRASEE